MIVIQIRRYRCTRCQATMTVLPKELASRRHYSASAIALAFAIYGVLGASLLETRRRVSAWPIVGATAFASWAQLRRWDRAIADSLLFPTIRGSPESWRLRQRAERAAMTLAAYAPANMKSASIEARVFAGAALAR